MAEQWEEEQHLEDIVERRMEGSSLKLDVVQKVPELVVKTQKKRIMCQDGPLERLDIAAEEDTDEMKRWRSLNQSGMDRCWKSLAERMEEEVLDKYKVEESQRGASKGTPWNGEEHAKTRDKIRKW